MTERNDDIIEMGARLRRLISLSGMQLRQLSTNPSTADVRRHLLNIDAGIQEAIGLAKQKEIA